MRESPTLALTRKLIERPSVTPADTDCQRLMAEHLSTLGFRCHHLRFGDVDNLWAVHGDQGPLFAFAGHTDVVPSGPETAWQHPPFQATLKNGLLYGRGAADMKGSLAAMMTATEAFLAETPAPRGRIGFLITSDEEGPAVNGTVKVVEWLQQQQEHIDWCLVGEPSSHQQLGDRIRVGRRGSLSGYLTVLGTQGHVAYPELADNPIHRALPVLAELAAIEWDRGNAFFPPTSFQIANWNAGTGAGNVIPGECQLQFNFRFCTEQTADGLKQQVEQHLNAHGLHYTLRWELSGQPFLTDQGALLDATRNAIRHATGLDTDASTGGGTSDGRFIAPTGTEVIELGPVNASIHQIDEHVSAADLDTLSRIYQHILKQLLG